MSFFIVSDIFVTPETGSQRRKISRCVHYAGQLKSLSKSGLNMRLRLNNECPLSRSTHDVFATKPSTHLLAPNALASFGTRFSDQFTWPSKSDRRKNIMCPNWLLRAPIACSLFSFSSLLFVLLSIVLLLFLKNSTKMRSDFDLLTEWFDTFL